MIPINKNNKKCAVASSDCIIWDGPDLDCINVCKGDSVTEVMYRVAKLVCELQEKVSIDNLDLTCLNLPSCESPEELIDVIQLLIDRVCELSNGSENGGGGSNGEGGCPSNCIVDVPECFWYVDHTGVDVTSMGLMEFITAIANRVCNGGYKMNAIDDSIVKIDTRVTALEKKPEPIFVLPEIIPEYVLPRVPTPMDEVLIATESQFGSLRESTGKINDIYEAISKMPNGLSDSKRLAGSGIMATIEGWNRNNNSLSDSIGNLWLAYGDLRAAVMNIQKNCCGSGCDGVEIFMQTKLNGTQLTIYLNGVIPEGMSDCHLEGALFKVSDTNGAFSEIRIPILSMLNNSLGYIVDLKDTPVDSNIDLIIDGHLCLKNEETGSECKFLVTDYKNIVEPCPVLSFSETIDSISYQGTWSGQTAMVSVELWANDESTIIASNTSNLSNGGDIKGVFSNLASSKKYKVRIKISKNEKDQTCPFLTVSTLSPACTPPDDVTSNIE